MGAAPALDLSYLLDYVMEEVKPLDWDAVIKSPIPLKVRLYPLKDTTWYPLADFCGLNTYGFNNLTDKQSHYSLILSPTF